MRKSLWQLMKDHFWVDLVFRFVFALKVGLSDFAVSILVVATLVIKRKHLDRISDHAIRLMREERLAGITLDRMHELTDQNYYMFGAEVETFQETLEEGWISIKDPPDHHANWSI